MFYFLWNKRTKLESNVLASLAPKPVYELGLLRFENCDFGVGFISNMINKSTIGIPYSN
jgi:hypothetical protein